MGFIAFDISLNGKRQYTVGAEEWQTIWAHVIGHYIDPSKLPLVADEDESELSNEPFCHVQLRASISVSGEDVEVTGPDGHVYTKSKSGSFPASILSPGDVVEIRVIETDEADSPEWEQHDPRFPGGVAIMPDPASEKSGHLSNEPLRRTRKTNSNAVQEYADAISSSIAEKNWFSALFVALSIPDICGYLESPNEPTGSRYEKWFQKYVSARYSMRTPPNYEHHQFFLGSDCYALRCALLHQGQEAISDRRAEEVINRFHFVAPPDDRIVHCHRLNDGLQLQVDIFCQDILSGLMQWTEDVASDELIQSRMQKTLEITM